MRRPPVPGERACDAAPIARESVAIAGQERRQRGRPQAHAAVDEKVAPRSLMQARASISSEPDSPAIVVMTLAVEIALIRA